MNEDLVFDDDERDRACVPRILIYLLSSPSLKHSPENRTSKPQKNLWYHTLHRPKPKQLCGVGSEGYISDDHRSNAIGVDPLHGPIPFSG